MWVAWLLGCANVGLELTQVDGELTVEPRGVLAFERTSPYGHGSSEKLSLTANFNEIEIEDVFVEAQGGAFFVPDDYRWPRVLRNGQTLELPVRFEPAAHRRYEGTIYVVVADGELIRRDLQGGGCLDYDKDGEC